MQALRAELDAGHPVTGPYSSDAAVAADQINAVNRSRLVPISSSELLAWSGQASALDRPRNLKIAEGKANPVEAIAAICVVAESTINRDGTSLDLNLSDRAAMLEALVAGGVLSDADKSSLYDIATEAISRATELGLGNIRPGTVEQARAL